MWDPILLNGLYRNLHSGIYFLDPFGGLGFGGFEVVLHGGLKLKNSRGVQSQVHAGQSVTKLITDTSILCINGLPQLEPTKAPSAAEN